MIKYIKDLTIEQLRNLYYNNKEIQEKVFDDMWESESFWLEDKLDGCPCDYSIGGSYGDYFRIESLSQGYDCLKWIERLDHDYCFLCVDEVKETKERYERYLKIMDKLDYYMPCKIEDYNNVCDLYEKAKSELEDYILSELASGYNSCYDNGNLQDYFVEFYADERMKKDSYIKVPYNFDKTNETDDWTVYEGSPAYWTEEKFIPAHIEHARYIPACESCAYSA